MLFDEFDRDDDGLLSIEEFAMGMGRSMNASAEDQVGLAVSAIAEGTSVARGTDVPVLKMTASARAFHRCVARFQGRSIRVCRRMSVHMHRDDGLLVDRGVRDGHRPLDERLGRGPGCTSLGRMTAPRPTASRPV